MSNLPVYPIAAKFESSVIGRDDRKAIVYQCAPDSFNVSYYVNDSYVYSVPQSFETLAEACDDAQSYVRTGDQLTDLASVATEIKSVAAEYIDSRYDELTDVQKACLVEITTSLSITDSRILVLWDASGLTY